MRDQDTIRRFDLLELSREDYWFIFKAGCLVTGVAYLVVGGFAAVTDTESWFYLFTPPLIGVLFMLWVVRAAGRRLTPIQRERLTRQRDLIVQCEKMQAAAWAAGACREAALAGMVRLRTLITRMGQLHPEEALPAGELAGLEERCRVLADRAEVERDLGIRYRRECSRLAIEIEMLDIIPGEAEEALAARLARLEALEEATAARRRHRSAEAELAAWLESEAA